MPSQAAQRCPCVAGKELGVAKLRADGGLSTRRACSKRFFTTGNFHGTPLHKTQSRSIFAPAAEESDF